MGQPNDETETLRAEVAELRAEVERLRGGQSPMGCMIHPVTSGVTFVAGDVPCTCSPPKPSWGSTLSWTSTAAGCAGGGNYPQVIYPGTAGFQQTFPAAGCAGGYDNTYLVNVAGGQY